MSRRTNSFHTSDRQKDMDDLVRGLPSRSGHRREAKKWGKFVLKLLIILSVCSVTVYGVNLLWKRFVVFNQDFKLEKIQFETNGHMTEADVRRMLELTGEENVLFLDISGLEEKLKARPDIVKASINRELPATLVVELEERVPVAWLDCPQDNLYGRDKENGKLVDSSGYIFSYEPELHKRYESCPVIRVAPPMDGHYGAGEWLEGTSPRQGLNFLRTSRAFVNEGVPLVQSLDFVNDWSFVAHFPDGMAITFGLFDHERQLHDLALVLQHAKATNRSVKSANMMPARNMPVVFGDKKDVPIVQAEVVDEESPSPSPPANLAGRRAEERESAGNSRVASDNSGARNNAGDGNISRGAEESRESGRHNAASSSGSSASRRAVTSRAAPARAAEVVDDEPAPAARRNSSSTNRNASSAGRNSTRSSGENASSSRPQRRASSSGQREQRQASSQSRPRQNTPTSSGSRNSSSGSSGGGKPAPKAPEKKQVEVPSFNW